MNQNSVTQVNSDVHSEQGFVAARMSNFGYESRSRPVRDSFQQRWKPFVDSLHLVWKGAGVRHETDAEIPHLAADETGKSHFHPDVELRWNCVSAPITIAHQHGPG